MSTCRIDCNISVLDLFHVCATATSHSHCRGNKCMTIFAFSNVKSRECFKGPADGALGFSSSLHKRKLCRLHLLFLLLTSDYDQGEERKHHPSFQKSLHLHRQQVGPRPSAGAVRSAALLHSRVSTRSFSVWNLHVLPVTACQASLRSPKSCMRC